jgi:hypothetical protein
MHGTGFDWKTSGATGQGRAGSCVCAEKAAGYSPSQVGGGGDRSGSLLFTITGVTRLSDELPAEITNQEDLV